MRNFEERKAEIFRRSEERIKENKRRRNIIIITCVPVLIGIIVLSVTVFPSMLQDEKSTITCGFTAENDIINNKFGESSSYNTVTTTNKADIIEYSHNFANMSLEVFDGWEYQINKYEEGAYSFGISFWPKGHSYGKLTLEYYPDMFGVCGTGLSEKNIKLAGHNARQGIYDNQNLWNFIVFTDTPGDYVIRNEGADKWWDRYGEEAIKILQSTVIAKDIISKPDAIEIARKQSDLKFVETKARFDYEKGLWKVEVFSKENTGGGQTILINADGELEKILHNE